MHSVNHMLFIQKTSTVFYGLLVQAFYAKMGATLPLIAKKKKTLLILYPQYVLNNRKKVLRNPVGGKYRNWPLSMTPPKTFFWPFLLD